MAPCINDVLGKFSGPQKFRKDSRYIFCGSRQRAKTAIRIAVY